MPSLTAITCYRKPDLGLVWENIRQKGVQPFQEVVLHSNASRSFKIINPETGLEAQPGVPIVVLEAYEDMYTALFAARDDSKRHEGSTCLFYIGYPGIGQASRLRQCRSRLTLKAMCTVRQDHIHVVRLCAMLPGTATPGVVLGLARNLLSAHRSVNKRNLGARLEERKALAHVYFHARR